MKFLRSLSTFIIICLFFTGSLRFLQILFSYLTFILPDFIIYAVRAVQLVVVAPILIIASLRIFRIVRKEFTLQDFNMLLKIIISGIIVYSVIWWNPALDFYYKTIRPSPEEISRQTNNIAGWKTFENEEFGLILKYPPYLEKLEKKTVGEQVIIFKLAGVDDGPYFRVTVYRDLEPEQVYKFQRGGWQSFLEEEKDIVVDGFRGKMLIAKDFVPDKDAGANDHQWSAAAIISNDKTYKFEAILRDTKHPEYAIFNQVVSTIKFKSRGINKFEIVPNTENWSIYTNTLSGYTIRYPGEWMVEEGPNFQNARRISYTIFEDRQKFTYRFAIEVSPFADYAGFVASDEGGTCQNPQLISIVFRSGLKVELKECEKYGNYYLLKYPDRNLFISIRSEKGLVDSTTIDAFISSLAF